MIFSSISMIIYVAYIFAIVTYRILLSPLQGIHPSFLWEYISRDSLRIFATYWIPVHWTVMLYTASRPLQTDLKESVSRMMIYNIMMLSIYVGVVFFILPPNLTRQRTIRYVSSYFKELHREVLQRIDGQSYYEALLLVQKMNRMIKHDTQAERLLVQLQNSIAKSEKFFQKKTSSNNIKEENKSPSWYVRTAESYLQQKDSISAYYYIQLAIRAMVKPTVQSIEIARTALRSLRSFNPPISDKMQQSFYKKKEKGLRAFINGSTDPSQYITAYFIFKDLQAKRGKDPDILHYYEVSKKAVTRVSFFVEDAEKARSAPGISSLVVLNKKKGTIRQFIVADRVTFWEGEEYFFNVEVLTLDITKGVVEHFKAPYAKRISDYLNFRAIDSNRQLETFTVFRGQDTQRFIFLSREMPNIMYINDPEWLQGENIVALWQLSKNLTHVNQAASLIRQEFLIRINRLFIFIVFAFFMVGLGGHITRQRPFSFVSLLFLPIVFWVLLLFFALVDYAISLQIAYILNRYSFTTTITILGIFDTMLLIFTLSYAMLELRRKTFAK